VSDTERTPIVDKNGKATHVYKGTSVAPAPEPRLENIVPKPAQIEEIDPKAKAFPNAKELHLYGCKCADCQSGASVPEDEWIDKATIGDILAVMNAPDWFNPDDEDNAELVDNQSNSNKFNLMFRSGFDSYTTRDFVTRVEEDYLEHLGGYSNAISAVGTPRFNDDYMAVDPDGCGCTECLIGEYIPEQNWTPYATAGDVAAVVRGDISNHTHGTDFGLVFHTSFSDREAANLVTALEEEFDEHISSLNLERSAGLVY